MDTTEVVERVLAHHGVKGMKWGQRRAASKIAKGDKKFAKRITSPSKNLNLQIELHNATGKAMNEQHIPRINKKYEKAIKDHTLLDHDHPTTKKYYKEYEDAYISELNKEASKMVSPSGKRTYVVHKSTQSFLGFVVSATDTKVKHADSTSFRVEYILGDNGEVVGFKIRKAELTQSALAVEDILAHHGVKGMRWGIRRKATVGAREVIVSDRRKKVKTSGGQGHPAHPDAVRVRTSGQIAKKSGVKALSDQELQAYAKRLQLEQSVKRLSYHDKPAAQRFAMKVLGQTGQNTVQSAANDVASQQVKKALVKAALVAA